VKGNIESDIKAGARVGVEGYTIMDITDGTEGGVRGCSGESHYTSCS